MVAPTLPANYTKQKRILSFKTDGASHILPFVQDGDYVRWLASVLDINATNPGIAAVTATLASVPTGVNVQWLGNAVIQGDNPTSIYVSDLAANDEAPITRSAAPGVPGETVNFQNANTNNSSQVMVRTNTSAQVRYRLSVSDAGIIVGLVTLGWFDRRGRG